MGALRYIVGNTMPDRIRYFVASPDTVSSTKVELGGEHLNVSAPVVSRYNLDLLMNSRVPRCPASSG